MYSAIDLHLLLLESLASPERILSSTNLLHSIFHCPVRADDPELLSEFVYVRHGGQSFPQPYRATLLRRDGDKVVTICVVTGSHVNSPVHIIMKMLNISLLQM